VRNFKNALIRLASNRLKNIFSNLFPLTLNSNQPAAAILATAERGIESSLKVFTKQGTGFVTFHLSPCIGPIHFDSAAKAVSRDIAINAISIRIII
jgi:hypothetical protein